MCEMARHPLHRVIDADASLSLSLSTPACLPRHNHAILEKNAKNFLSPKSDGGGVATMTRSRSGGNGSYSAVWARYNRLLSTQLNFDVL